jgi:flagellar hook-basal body complex protein FliE
MPIRPDSGIVSQLERGGGGISLPIGGGDEGPSFADALKRVVGNTQGAQDNRDQMIGAFLRGEPVELHQVMAASEEAAISLEFLVEMRNKLTDAYRSVMSTST